MNHAHTVGKFAKLASASLLTAAILFISLLGASPSLHKILHADAGAADHHCVITLFAKGLVSTADVAPLVIAAIILFGGVALLAESFSLSQADYRFSASRAPPLFSSSRIG